MNKRIPRKLKKKREKEFEKEILRRMNDKSDLISWEDIVRVLGVESSFDFLKNEPV